jgi:hypothetical protein
VTLRLCSFLVVVLAACDEHATEVKAKPACFVDEMPTRMTNSWHVRKECTLTNLACRWWCLRGDEDACFNRAIAIERTSETEATELFAEACRLGLTLGCTNWAAHQWSTHHGDWHCTNHVFSKTCAFKEPLACGMVGRMTMEHGGTPNDMARGKAQLQSACDDYGGMPCRMFAYYMEMGKFGIPNRTTIVALMKRACEGGDAPACGDHATVDETFWSPDGSGSN